MALTRLCSITRQVVSSTSSPCVCQLDRVSSVAFNQSHASYSTEPTMPPCDFQPTKYSGPGFDKAMQIRRENVTPSTVVYYKDPIMIHQGHMQWLWDINGRRYLDLFAGIVTVSVGHCHPKIVAVVEKQLKTLWHTTSIYMYPGIYEYAEKLAATLPPHLNTLFFTASGSEANDLALYLARLHTGMHETISLRNGFHGSSPYLMGLTALSTWRNIVPTGFGNHHTMNPDVFQGPWGGANCRDSPSQTIRSCDCPEGQCMASDKYIEQLEDVMKYSMPKGRLAGFFAEPIQGVGGAVQLPRGFLRRAFEMVRSRGGLCISDEVQTGFGRTGDHFWGFQSDDAVPDIVTMAKGIGNGFPLAALATSNEIASHMAKALHFNTFGGNPLSCAVGSAVLDVIEESKTQELSKNVGTYFINKLMELRDEFECVGDVRGKGLMIGVEFVTDKASRKPLDAPSFAAIFESIKNKGVLVGRGGLGANVMRIKPPMCITNDDVDFAISVMRQAFQEHEDSK